MSKMDELRALREARYEHTLARAAAHRAGTDRPGAAGREAPSRDQRPSPRTPANGQAGAEQPRPPSTEAPEAPEAEARLCGHRAISGRTCTREHGHSAKSHRYS